MKLHNFLKYAFTGLLLTTPLYAFATDVTVPGQEVGIVPDSALADGTKANITVKITVNGDDQGVVASTTNVPIPIGNFDTTGANPTISIALTQGILGVGLTPSADPANLGVAGIFVDNTNANNKLTNTTIIAGDINLTGAFINTHMSGFVYDSLLGQAFDANTLNLGAVTVTNTDNTGTGRNFGVGFISDVVGGGGGELADITGTTMTINSINVNGRNANGFLAKDILGNADIQVTNDITLVENIVGVFGQAGTYGVNLNRVGDGAGAETGKVTVRGKIDVTSNNIGGAWGIGIGDKVDNGSTVQVVGDIKVDSTGGNGSAIGVEVAGTGVAGTFTLSKVDAKGNANADGIKIAGAIANTGIFTVNDVIAEVVTGGNATGITTGAINAGGQFTVINDVNAKTINGNAIGIDVTAALGGTFQVGNNVNTTVAGASNAIGIRTLGIDAGGQFTVINDVNATVDATGIGSSATGIDVTAGALSGALQVNNAVLATNNGVGNADGIRVAANAAGSTLTVSNVTAQAANGNANGIDVTNALNGTFTANKVSATSTAGGNANGIRTVDIAANGSLTTNDEVLATSTNGNAFGINVGNIAANGKFTAQGVVSATDNGAGVATGINAVNIAGEFEANNEVQATSTGGFATGINTGNIDANGKFTAQGVVSATDNAAGNATGIRTGAIAANGEFAANNAVRATSTGGFATGINTGNIDANGKFTAQGVVSATDNAAGNATGIVTGNIAADGSFIANTDVTARSTNGQAVGVNVGQVNNNFTVAGKVNAISDTGSAVGMNIAGGSTLTIATDVIATSNANRTVATPIVGIQTIGGNNNLNINGDIEITGRAADGNLSIAMGGGVNDTLTIGNTDLHTNNGQQFVVRGAENVHWSTDANYVAGSAFETIADATHEIETGRMVMLDGNVRAGNYNFGSNANNNNAGTFMVQQINTAGNLTVNNGRLLINGNNNSVVGGTLIVGNDNVAAQAPAMIAFYGNVNPNNVALQLGAALPAATFANAIVDPITRERVLSLSSITEYRYDATLNAYVTRNREQAALADGFLLPALIHNRVTAWEATRDHFISATRRTQSGREYLGQAPCNPCDAVSDCDPCGEVCDDSSCEPCDPCNTHKFRSGLLLGSNFGRSAWVNYVGRSSEYSSSFLNGDWEMGSDGVQVGLDLYRTQSSQFGLLFGYEGTQATLRGDRMESDDVYFGAYAARVFRNGTDFRAVYSYGSQDYTMRRMALDVAAGFIWNTHNATFNGHTHEINLEFGKRIFRNRRLSYRPVIGFDLLLNDWNGAREDGVLTTAVAYGDTNFAQAFLRFGSDMKYELGRFELNSGLYYSYDLNGKQLHGDVFARTATGGIDRAISSSLFGSDLGRSVLTFNVGGTYALSKCASVFGGFTGDTILDGDNNGLQSIGYVGLQWKW